MLHYSLLQLLVSINSGDSKKKHRNISICEIKFQKYYSLLERKAKM